jgi:hypothetical protein
MGASSWLTTVSGPLAAHYLLNPTTIEGAVTVKEDELKPWVNK